MNKKYMIKNIIEQSRIEGGDEYDAEKLEKDINKHIIRLLERIKNRYYPSRLTMSVRINVDKEIKKLQEVK